MTNVSPAARLAAKKQVLLFNFAVSWSGGGLKRLREFSRVFDQAGGAAFIVHPRCRDLIDQFPNNKYYVVDQPRYQRLFNDCGYLDRIIRELGVPDLYYAFGIPMYRRVGRVNWFHLTNVLTLTTRNIPLHLAFRLKVEFLGLRVRRYLRNADVISAESVSALDAIGADYSSKLFLSVNGSDDELASLGIGHEERTEDIATVVGTYTYKALGDSLLVFNALRPRHASLRLIIIGDTEDIPRRVRDAPNVVLTGALPRPDVIQWLRRSRYYISTTYVENSYNAASEGAYLAEESYVSDIGPHRQLLDGVPFERTTFPGVSRPMLHVRRTSFTGANLRNWEGVVNDIMEKVGTILCEQGSRNGK